MEKDYSITKYFRENLAELLSDKILDVFIKNSLNKSMLMLLAGSVKISVIPKELNCMQPNLKNTYQKILK
jgi:hypothetical protein